MVDTIKISEMTDGGDLSQGNVLPGISGGANFKYTAGTQFLSPFTTATRPAAGTAGQIGFNTDLNQFQYDDGTDWVTIADFEAFASNANGLGASLVGIEDQGSVSNKTVQDFNEAPFIAQTDDGTLPNAQFLGALATGLVKNTTSTGVLSIAVPGTDYDVVTWQVINSNTNAVASNGYIVDHGSNVTCTLPGTAAVGDTFFFGNTQNTGRVVIQAAAGDAILYGPATTTSGGAITANQGGCFLKLICIVANTTFMVGDGSVGSFTLS